MTKNNKLNKMQKTETNSNEYVFKDFDEFALAYFKIIM